MTNEILKLINNRERYRNKNKYKHNQIHKAVMRKIKEAKETWLQEKCLVIETLNRKHDTFQLQKKIKEMATTTKTKIKV